MYTMMTVIRKKPEVSSADFRHFMEFEYGPTYSGLPETSVGIHSGVVDRTVKLV
jgi:hypothetical protein